MYYWRGDNYLRDLDEGAGYHLNQRNPLLHRIDLGDSLWAFTRREADGAYGMAVELVVRGKSLNPRDHPYGPYRLWGDLRRSRYFRLEGQRSMERLLRALSPTMRAERLGQAFQGRAAVRPLTEEDHAILTAACRDLALEPRARLLPEERLEYELHAGPMTTMTAIGTARTSWLVEDRSGGLGPARRTYLTVDAPPRSRRLVQQLQAMYGGKCQLCGWSGTAPYGVSVAEAHHLLWLSRGGADHLDNMVLLCPNHHRAVHACDAHLDFADLHMDFGGGLREPLLLDGHLQRLIA